MCRSKYFLYLLLSTFLLFEISLRFISPFLNEPTRSFILEAARIPYSNKRTYGGFRGNPRILLPPSMKADLLIVGDSIPFGTYVRSKHIFSTLLSEELGLQIVNLAVGSQSPPAYHRMVEVGRRYEPRFVLYCIFANDFIAGGMTRPPPDDELFLEKTNFKETFAHSIKSLTNFSLAYQLLKFAEQPSTQHTPLLWNDGKRTLAFSPKKYWDPSLDWNRPDVRRAVERNIEWVQKSYDLLSKETIQMAVLLFPSKEMVFAPVVGQAASAFYSPSHQETFNQFELTLNNAGIPSFDLTNDLRNSALNGETLFHTIDGHFNEQGHQRIGRLITKFIHHSWGEIRRPLAFLER